MEITSFQQAKLILLVNFVVLFAIIITTPFFIDQGILIFTEEGVEAFFLTIELVAAVFIFRHYDIQIIKKEDEARHLNVELEKKEKELLGTLEYLGKINVQMSLVESLFEVTKIPTTKSQLHDMYAELLKIVESVTKKRGVFLRVVDLENKRTLGEHLKFAEETSQQINIGNGELAERFKEKSKKSSENFSIFYSDASDFQTKVFIFIPHIPKKNFSQAEKIFIKAIANLCEIMFLTFNLTSSSKYRKFVFMDK